MIDIIQRVLAEYGLASCRIDGSVPSKNRQKIIDDFNEGHSYGPDICLLTTRACGYGITLTGADRVIIFDPSWNPAEDRQAVDRAYRIGQKNDVVVYRMIMAGTVEEKMYEKQVFKDGLRVVTESGASSRYFSSDETKELFTLGPAHKSTVMEKLWNKFEYEMKSVEDFGGEVIAGVVGYSRHDTLYDEKKADRPKKVVIDLTQEDDHEGDSHQIIHTIPEDDDDEEGKEEGEDEAVDVDEENWDDDDTLPIPLTKLSQKKIIDDSDEDEKPSVEIEVASVEKHVESVRNVDEDEISVLTEPQSVPVTPVRDHPSESQQTFLSTIRKTPFLQLEDSDADDEADGSSQQSSSLAPAGTPVTTSKQQKALIVYHPKESVSEEDWTKYEELVDEARRFDSMNDLIKAAAKYCDALEICDQDETIHRRLKRIGKTLCYF